MCAACLQNICTCVRFLICILIGFQLVCCSDQRQIAPSRHSLPSSKNSNDLAETKIVPKYNRNQNNYPRMEQRKHRTVREQFNARFRRTLQRDMRIIYSDIFDPSSYEQSTRRDRHPRSAGDDPNRRLNEDFEHSLTTGDAVIRGPVTQTRTYDGLAPNDLSSNTGIKQSIDRRSHFNQSPSRRKAHGRSHSGRSRVLGDNNRRNLAEFQRGPRSNRTIFGDKGLTEIDLWLRDLDRMPRGEIPDDVIDLIKKKLLELKNSSHRISRRRHVRRSAPGNGGSGEATTWGELLRKLQKNTLTPSPNRRKQRKNRRKHRVWSDRPIVAAEPGAIGTIPQESEDQSAGDGGILVEFKLLYIHKSGRFVRIDQNGKVESRLREKCDNKCVIRFKTIDLKHGDIFVQIKGEKSGRYLAINKSGRLYTTVSAKNPDTHFIHFFNQSIGDTYRSRHDYFLAFRGSGRPYRRSRFKQPHKHSHFLELKADKSLVRALKEPDVPLTVTSSSKRKCPRSCKKLTGKTRKSCQRRRKRCRQKRKERRRRRKSKKANSGSSRSRRSILGSRSRRVPKGLMRMLFSRVSTARREGTQNIWTSGEIPDVSSNFDAPLDVT
ncbi:uncharacterized protein LOC143469815 [Clavelina lepadiformis]|uniref:uncharacterized protein LOC143469815 n=1 Tax=Clavelina lepadiformis TaxID=159417 RepID=UPI0040419B9A